MRFDFTIHRLHFGEIVGFHASQLVWHLEHCEYEYSTETFFLFDCVAQKHQTEQKRVLCALCIHHKDMLIFVIEFLIKARWIHICPHSGVIYQVSSSLCSWLEVWSFRFPLRYYSTALQTCMAYMYSGCNQFAVNLSSKCQNFRMEIASNESLNSPAFLRDNRMSLPWFLFMTIECYQASSALQRQR